MCSGYPGKTPCKHCHHKPLAPALDLMNNRIHLSFEKGSGHSDTCLFKRMGRTWISRGRLTSQGLLWEPPGVRLSVSRTPVEYMSAICKCTHCMKDQLEPWRTPDISRGYPQVCRSNIISIKNGQRRHELLPCLKNQYALLLHILPCLV